MQLSLCSKLQGECFLLHPAVEMSDGDSQYEQLRLASNLHPWGWAACLAYGEGEVPMLEFPS